jgi:multiple antibiotic resistance protein
VVLLTDNDIRTLREQAITTGELAICVRCFSASMPIASLLFRLLGRGGIEVVSRVFGLIVASIAVTT